MSSRRSASVALSPAGCSLTDSNWIATKWMSYGAWQVDDNTSFRVQLCQLTALWLSREVRSRSWHPYRCWPGDGYPCPANGFAVFRRPPQGNSVLDGRTVFITCGQWPVTYFPRLASYKLTAAQFSQCRKSRDTRHKPTPVGHWPVRDYGLLINDRWCQYCVGGNTFQQCIDCVDISRRSSGRGRQTTVRWQRQVFIHTRLSRAYLALARLSCLYK